MAARRCTLAEQLRPEGATHMTSEYLSVQELGEMMWIFIWGVEADQTLAEDRTPKPFPCSLADFVDDLLGDDAANRARAIRFFRQFVHNDPRIAVDDLTNLFRLTWREKSYQFK